MKVVTFCKKHYNAAEKANVLIFALLNTAKVIHPLIEIVYVDEISL